MTSGSRSSTNANASSSSENTAYLADLCRACTDDKVEFRQSPSSHGLGVFARVDIAAGELIFAIPRHLILSSMCPQVLKGGPYSRIQTTLSKDLRIPAEYLLFAHIILEFRSSSTNPYLTSLPTGVTPLHASELTGTNVGAQVQRDAQAMRDQLRVMNETLSSVSRGTKPFSLEELQLAKGLYNSRRFPLRFSLDHSTIDDEAATATVTATATVEEGAMGNSTPAPTDDGGGGGTTPTRNQIVSKRKRRRNDEEERRAVYDATQGSLVPLLDVLNHRGEGQPHLRWDVTPTTLRVMAACDIPVGHEIYYNYDCASNDQFLLQFGFVVGSNDGDTMEHLQEVQPTTIISTTSMEQPLTDDGSVEQDPTATATSTNSCTRISSLDVFTVQVGGERFDLTVDQEIPDALLGDGGYGLEQHLLAKQAAQATATPSTNPHVRAYMAVQNALLTHLLHQVRLFIQEHGYEQEMEAEQPDDSDGDDGEDVTNNEHEDEDFGF